MEVIELDYSGLRAKLDQLDSFNPWAVTDPSMFLNYCCPECDFKCNKLQTFSSHGLENHVKSSVLFKVKPKNYDQTLVKENIDTLNQVIEMIPVTNQDPEIVQDYQISDIEKLQVLHKIDKEKENTAERQRKKRKLDTQPVMKNEEIPVEFIVELCASSQNAISIFPQ